MVLSRVAVGMGGRKPVLRSLRIPDHIHPSGGAGQAAILSQLLCAEGAAHLAGVPAGARHLLWPGGLVCGSAGGRGDPDGAVVGLSAVCTEPVSPEPAGGTRTHVVA